MGSEDVMNALEIFVTNHSVISTPFGQLTNVMLTKSPHAIFSPNVQGVKACKGLKKPERWHKFSRTGKVKKMNSSWRISEIFSRPL